MPMVHPRSERIINNLLETRFIRRQGFRSATLANRMRTHAIPGLSFAVIDNYTVDLAEGFGVREAGRPDPVTPETIFQAASISKPVTAAAVMRLVRDGLLDLDEDVNRYLTSWKVPPNGTWQPRVTLRQVLSHSAGMTVHGFVGYNRKAPIPTLLQVLDGAGPANTGPVRVDHLPGVRYRYSGGGITVVQQLLEDVLKAPFETIMQDIVLRPLGMVNSTFAQPLPEAHWDHAASGHQIGGGVVDGKWHVQPESSAGGLWTTPSDLARLVIDLQLALAGRPAKLFTRELAEQVVTPNPGGCGIGFHLDGPRFNHLGDNVGFNAFLVGHKEGGRGAIVMNNGAEGWRLLDEVVRAVAVEYEWPLTYPADFNNFPVRVPEPPQVDQQALARHAGDYLLRDDYPVKIMAQSGQLFVQAAGQPPVPMVAASESQFYSEQLNMFAHFQDGETLVLYVAGQPFSARRQ